MAALLAAVEAAQTRLPGRTPEITDPLLALLLARRFDSYVEGFALQPALSELLAVSGEQLTRCLQAQWYRCDPAHR